MNPASAQNTIAEFVRREARRAATSLGLPDNGATAKLCADALRNAAQTFQLEADADIDMTLGRESTTFPQESNR